MDTIERIAGHVVCSGIYGTSLTPSLTRSLQQRPRGGIILMGRNVESPKQVHRLLRDVVATTDPSDPPLLVGVDQEGGRVARLKAPVTQLPNARALGSLDDTNLTQRAYHALGRQLRALGFTVDFAPVLDVDDGAAGNVIGDRAFSGDAQTVARQGVAALRGLLQAGLCPCGKHFPGHGTTTVDSHLDLPQVHLSRQKLVQRDLVPFVEALRAGLPLLMPAHVVFHCLDSDRPATWSPAVVHQLLRQELGFDGVVVTDDLTMGAVAHAGGARDGAVEALMAGADLLLICHDEDLQEQVIDNLADQARRHQSVAQRLQEAARRVGQLRRRFAPAPAVTVDDLGHDEESLDVVRTLEERLE
jgi:beta-N-acetylhexosaminidase